REQPLRMLRETLAVDASVAADRRQHGAPEALDGVNVGVRSGHAFPVISGVGCSAPAGGGSIDVPAKLRAIENRRCNFLDRLFRRVERGYAFALHQPLAFAHFIAAVVERRILAAGAPLLA